MGKWLFGLTWAFILGVAGYDTYFAWQYRAVFEAWEINPLARLVAGQFGVGAVFALKALVVSCSVAVAIVCQRWRRRVAGLLYTTCLGGIHLALALFYIVSYAWP
jgi:hypothetical protein